MTRDPNAFEEPVLEIKAKIEGLKAQLPSPAIEKEIDRLEARRRKLQKEIFGSLSDWQRCILARHPKRPYSRDYIEGIFDEFEEIHGDRRFADDPAIMAGFAVFQGQSVCVVGQQKGRDMKQKLYRNFGMPRPEGYRKAIRVMQMAEKFAMPIITFIDTPGAYPGIDAEERGQAEAIAYNLREMSLIETPILVYVIGEGGSGGALGIGIGDHICILENAIYSVISPEGCASILWKDANQMAAAADALHLTSSKLMQLELVDSVLEEPPGGAHDDPPLMIEKMRGHLAAQLKSQTELSVETRLEARYRKFRSMGIYTQAG